MIPRTVDATAVLFAEPDITIPRTSISEENPGSDSHNDPSCNRPIISLAPPINTITTHPWVKNVMEKVDKVREPVSTLKMMIYDRLRIACLFPRIIKPFEPILKYTRCKLGLDNDEFMEAAKCNTMTCQASLEEKTITHDLGPAPMKMMNLGVQTMADCFGEMRPVRYGARVLAKIVNDKPCDDPRYQAMCKDAMEKGRIVEEEKCTTPEYV